MPRVCLEAPAATELTEEDRVGSTKPPRCTAPTVRISVQPHAVPALLRASTTKGGGGGGGGGGGNAPQQPERRSDLR